MRLFFHFTIVSFSILLSLLFIFFSSVVDSLFSFWFFLELAGMAVVPSFFVFSSFSLSGVYNGLMMYVVMSGVSSVFFVTGIVFNELYNFILVGFLIKLGLFPFLFWVYRVYSFASWSFIFILSVIMKFPILYFGYLFGGMISELVVIDCVVTIFISSVLFWLCSQCWQYVWCHMSLSSVSTLLVVSYTGDPVMGWFIYFYYSIWAISCIIYFSDCMGVSLGGYNLWAFCFILLITPVSLPLFYKLGVSVVLFYSSVYVLIVWSIYSFSEQFFLYKLFGDTFGVSVFSNWFC